MWRPLEDVIDNELYAIFPYRTYGIGKPEFDVALRSFAGRATKETGGWQQNAVKAARLGLADEARAMVSQNAARVAGGYRFPAIWGPNYDWIPDQGHGGVTMLAVQQMLLQTDPPSRDILLLPVWPKGWNVDFKLHAPEQTTIKGRVQDGKVVRLKLHPESRRNDVVFREPFVLESF